VGAVDKLSLISESVVEIRINNHPCRGINLTNMTYVLPSTGHIWQHFTTIPLGQFGCHLSLVHVFHAIPHVGLFVGGPYTIPMKISKWMVGYHPTTTSTELCWFTGPHKSGMWSKHNQKLVQGSTTNGHQLTQAGATTLEPRISTYYSPSFPSDDTLLSPSCLTWSQI
jgi:hypothetical protein